jgi:hypothetical protein
MEEDDDIKIAKGFDRDIDYLTIKDKLIACYNSQCIGIDNLDKEHHRYNLKKNNMIRKLMYILISLIQLRSGSRIIEAIKGLKLFLKQDDLTIDVIVKLAKSETKKYNGNKSFFTKARYRNMKFPIKWIELKYRNEIKECSKSIQNLKIRKGVLDYLLRNHKCNTHSLRYAYINYMLYTKKVEIGLVCKIVGHTNPNQIVRYTQNKNAKSVFDQDI